MGCDVDAAEDGEQAVALAGQIRYDLILLDLDMPLMNGTEAARAIRCQPSNRSTLIVAVSDFLGAVGDPSDRWRFFDSEVAKPISLDRLRQVISAVSPIHAGELGLGTRRWSVRSWSAACGIETDPAHLQAFQEANGHDESEH